MPTFSARGSDDWQLVVSCWRSISLVELVGLSCQGEALLAALSPSQKQCCVNLNLQCHSAAEHWQLVLSSWCSGCALMRGWDYC